MKLLCSPACCQQALMLVLCSSRQCFSTCVQGIRTVIASSSNATQEHVTDGQLHNETWVYYPGEACLA